MKHTEKLLWSRFLLLTVAGTINAVGVTLFLFPVKLYDSGVSGLSMLLDQVTPPELTLSVFLLILNVPIFLFGMRRLGRTFTVYSLFTVAVYALVSFVIRSTPGLDVSIASPLAGSDLLLCAIFGGALSGIGSGLTIRFGGAIDGVDVLSVMFAKRLGISIGTFNMLFNFTLYVICGAVLQSWILPLYSIVTYFVGAKTVDYVAEGFDRSKCAMIVTTHAAEISAAISERFRSGGTILDAVGGYTGQRRKVIYLIVNRFQIGELRTIVHRLDPSAFISLQDVSDIIRAADE